MTLLKKCFVHGLLFASSFTASQTALALPLGGVTVSMPTASEWTVRAEAQRQMEQKDTRFKSAEKENVVFEGVFIPASNSTQLAVVSDDGVTITINGANTNIANFGVGQAHTDINQVFKVVTLNTPFVAGRAYNLRVEYSNTVHTGPDDFDGMTLFAFNGGGRTQEVNLIISRGQEGYAVPDDDEETVGAFTVANANDTDSDSLVDHSDNTVIGEKDLMALEISRPAGPATDKATVKVTGGNARFWQSPNKSTAVPLTNGAAEFTLGALPKTIYVETTTVSPALRSISIELDYKGSKDTVKATGIWATLAASAHDTKDAATLLAENAWQDTTTPPRNRTVQYGGVGLRPANTNFGLRNVILMKFNVFPIGVEDYLSTSFDISRRSQGLAFEDFAQGQDKILWESAFPAEDERANDDEHNTDESIVVSPLRSIYSQDEPGITYLDAPEGIARLLIDLEFQEFVRVSFDGTRPSGQLSGSRCSAKYTWNVKHTLVPDGTGANMVYKRSTGEQAETDENSIG